MRLEYKILWFEDNDSWYESIIDEVKEFIEEDLCFEYVEPTRKKDDSDFGSINFNDYDLILMDLNLENSLEGNTLIQRIRDLDVFTDVIFYSAKGIASVRNVIKEKNLDGIYCVGRSNPDFINKFKKIVRTTIKKILDINNMRGLVMSEVAEMDAYMIKILEQYVKGLSDKEKVDFIEKRKSKICSSIEQGREQLMKISDETFFTHRDFNSNHKWRTVKEIIKKKKIDIKISEELDSYSKEILSRRNELAHVKEKIDQLTGQRILVDKDGNKYDDEAFKNLRQNIKKHEMNLKKILNLVSK